MADDLISVIDLAGQLGRRKATVFKILNRLGIEATKQRSQSNGGQLVSCITTEEAKLVAEELAATSESALVDDEGCLAVDDGERGVFYLISLEPTHDPGRFKLGFAVSLAERLRQHRCSAPFATVVQTWPCKRLWEKTAIESVAQGCERLHTEVFRCESIELVAQRCKQFFALMPPLVISSEPATASE